MSSGAPTPAPAPNAQRRPRAAMLWFFCGMGLVYGGIGALALIRELLQPSEFLRLVWIFALLLFCVPGLLLSTIAGISLQRVRAAEGPAGAPARQIAATLLAAAATTYGLWRLHFGFSATVFLYLVFGMLVGVAAVALAAATPRIVRASRQPSTSPRVSP